MPGKVTRLLLASLVLVSFRYGNTGSPMLPIVKLYNQADSLFHLSNPTNATDSAALTVFSEVINKLKKNQGYDTGDAILFQSYLKRGILLDLRSNYTEAKE